MLDILTPILIPIAEAVGASVVATLIILHALNKHDEEEDDDESDKG
jgi:hypothetical protein